jgi:antitoxin component of RelBE/YafQ-DinJ toxin-antitoxin module
MNVTNEVTLRLEKETLEELEKIARLSGVPVDQVVKVVLALYLNQSEGEKS